MDNDPWSRSDSWTTDEPISERLPLFDLSAWLQEDEEVTRSQPDLTTSGSAESVDHPTCEPLTAPINTLRYTPCDKELAERSLPVTDNQSTLDGCPDRPGSSSMDDASLESFNEAPNSMMAVLEQVPVHQCLNLLRHSEQRFRNIARLLYAAKLLEDGLKINKEGGSWKVCLKRGGS